MKNIYFFIAFILFFSLRAQAQITFKMITPSTDSAITASFALGDTVLYSGSGISHAFGFSASGLGATTGDGAGINPGSGFPKGTYANGFIKYHNTALAYGTFGIDTLDRSNMTWNALESGINGPIYAVDAPTTTDTLIIGGNFTQPYKYWMRYYPQSGLNDSLPIVAGPVSKLAHFKGQEWIDAFPASGVVHWFYTLDIDSEVLIVQPINNVWGSTLLYSTPNQSYLFMSMVGGGAKNSTFTLLITHDGITWDTLSLGNGTTSTACTNPATHTTYLIGNFSSINNLPNTGGLVGYRNDSLISFCNCMYDSSFPNGEYHVATMLPNGNFLISGDQLLYNNNQYTETGEDFLCSFFDSITGILVIPQKESVVIYPNPTLGRFTVTLPNNQTNYSVEVYNVMEEKIYQSVLSNSQNSINLSDYPSGIYFIYLKSEKGIEVKKILITK